MSIKSAREIAFAICEEYRLNPAEYERRGLDHPLIPVIARHVNQAQREAIEAAIEEVDLAGGDNAYYHIRAIRALLPPHQDSGVGDV